MDNTLKSLLQVELKVYPFDRIEDGQYLHKEPWITKCAVFPETTRVIDRDGISVLYNTAIYLDGARYFEMSENDEVETQFTGRVPIRKLIPYLDLQANVDSIKLIV